MGYVDRYRLAGFSFLFCFLEIFEEVLEILGEVDLMLLLMDG